MSNNKNIPCGCGRSPTGYCVGWHNLPIPEYTEKLREWTAQNTTNSQLLNEGKTTK
jgi:hypothetical protein